MARIVVKYDTIGRRRRWEFDHQSSSIHLFVENAACARAGGSSGDRRRYVRVLRMATWKENADGRRLPTPARRHMTLPSLERN